MIVYEPYILVAIFAEGLTFEDVVVEIKKPGSLVFEELTLTEESFKSSSYGYHNIEIPKELTDETGTYVFRIEYYENEVFEERECLPKPLSSTPPPGVCLITGNVRDVSGNAQMFSNVAVEARVSKLPSVNSGSVIIGGNIRTVTDFDGFFSLPLIIGSEVILEIKEAGVRFKAVIPNQQNIRIEDLIP